MSRDRTFAIIKCLLVFPDRTFARMNSPLIFGIRTFVIQGYPFVRWGFPDAFSGLHFYESGLTNCHRAALRSQSWVLRSQSWVLSSLSGVSSSPSRDIISLSRVLSSHPGVFTSLSRVLSSHPGIFSSLPQDCRSLSRTLGGLPGVINRHLWTIIRYSMLCFAHAGYINAYLQIFRKDPQIGSIIQKKACGMA